MALRSNDALVDYLIQHDRVRSDRVEEAFRKVDRKRFVTEQYEDRAYEDTPLPIGHGSTISAPHMVAEITELLEVQPHSSVVEIGSGSGYQLAILAELTDAEVHGIEIVEDLVRRSEQLLHGYDNVQVHHGSSIDAVTGDFDRVLFSCAVDSLDMATGRLSDGGILVAPVQQNVSQVLTRYRNGERTTHGFVRFVEYENED